MKKLTVMFVAGIILGSGMLFSGPQSWAHNPDGVNLPAECLPFVGGGVTDKIHDLHVVTPGPILPGQAVTARATFVGHSVVDYVRFVWMDGADNVVQNNMIPRPMPS